MKTHELLDYLSKLENGLDQFSFEELGVEEASHLKKTFLSFKNGLEAKVFGDNAVEVQELPQPINDHEALKLVADVSHEIRTPLNGIVGFIDLLQETPLNDAQKEIVQALNSASNSLMGIINELLEYSKLALNKEPFEQVPFNLANVVDELVFLSKTLLVDKKVTITSTIASDVPHNLVGDPSKLSQVLMNLLGNSVKFIKRGSIDISIEAQKGMGRNVVLQFKITDTGIGISDDNLMRIFESFKQAEPDTFKKYGGTGLGLSIVKQIIDKLGGQISVQSQLGQGTVFTFQIPFEIQLQNRSNGVEQIPANRTRFDFTGTQILVFEDNTLNQKLFQSQIESWGAQIILASDGAQGLRVLEKQQIDIILMDLRMPVLDGFEVSKRIRNHISAAINSIPIIAISADFTNEDKEKISKNGINDFLLKPYNIQVLGEKIHQVLYRSRLQVPHLVQPTEIELEGIKNKVNLTSLYLECNKNFDLMKELIGLFKGTMLEFIGKTRSDIKSGNFEGVHFASHKIRSSLKMFKLEEMVGLCDQLTTMAKEHRDMKGIEKVFETFVCLYPEIDLQITEHLKTFEDRD